MTAITSNPTSQLTSLPITRNTTQSNDKASLGVSISLTQRTQTASEAAQPSVSVDLDRVTLSQTSADATTDVDLEKVAEVRAKLSQGTYQVSSSDLAEAMLRKGLFSLSY